DHRKERSGDKAHAEVLEALLRKQEDRVAGERDDADPQARPRGDLVQNFVTRMAVGEPPSDHVTGGEVDEDEADQHSPHVEARAEEGSEQSRGPKLDAE